MKEKSLIYFLMGVFSVMVSWYLNKSILLAILHWCFWPIYLIWCLLTGTFADGGFMEIVNHYI